MKEEAEKEVNEIKKKKRKKALKLSQCINIFQGNEGVMKEGDGRKAITMLSSRNSSLIARKAIQKALEIGAACCLYSLGGKKKSEQNPKHLHQRRERLEMICAALINLPELSFHGLY